MICSEEVCCIAPSTCSVEFDSKVGSGSESIPPHVKKLLSSVHGHEVPLVPNEVAIHLLKIQSKYLDEHPCLCTSRFRHTLHQLGDESHQRLDKLCNELQLLTIENCEEVSTAESRRNFYNFFLPTIFDLNSLQLLAVPAVVDSGEIRKSVPVCSRDDERQVLVTRLESILARFVSDCRAIFAIEGECNNPIGIRPDDDPSSHSIVDHEHRKRHEEEDTCPEEIKLMKVACAELSLECSSSVAEVPKKDRRGSKTLQVIIPNNNNNFNTKSLEENSEPERDHHVHRYYSFLRSEHSRKGSHHSTRDPNHPHRHHGHHHHSHHGHHQNHHHHVQHNHELNSNAASSSYLEPSEAKEVSPRPQKWSPNIHNSTAVFQFSKVLPELDTKVTTTTEELQLISTAPRKRKDSKGSDPEHTDTKRISRSSSEILNGEDSVSQNHDDEEILRRTQSFCEAAIKLTEIQTSEVATSKPSGATSNQAAAQPTVACSFYVSDEDLSSQTPIDEIDYTTLGHPGFSATDDSNGSLVGRFDRDMGLHGKSYRPLDRSQRSRRSPRSRSSHKRKSHDSDEKPSEEVKPVVEDNTLEIGVKIMLEREDSFDSSLSSSPSSASSNSMTSENGPTTAEDDFEEDDEITIREDLKSNPDFDDELTFPRLRRASWGSIEPAVQDHMQTPDIQEPVVSWIPQIGLVRESPSALSSENDDFSSRHFGLLHSQKHLDPTHIQRLAIEKDSKRSKLKQLNKQLKSTRRKLEDLEEEFERNCGYKASHSEKQKNEKFRRLLSEQSKLRKQIQSCKESDFGHVDESVLSSSFGSNSSNMLFGTNMNNMSASSDDSFEQFVCESPTQTKTCAGKSLEAMTTFFISLEQKMKSQRTLAGRPFLLEEMTNEQILEEKRDLRSILHQMEMNFGYPSSEEEKNVTKDVFERYRTAKRMFRKNSATFRSKDSVELETIPEDLEIPLTLASPQHRIFIEVTTSTTVDQRASEVRPSLKSMNFFSSNTDEASFRLVDENLHAMSRFELMEIQRRTREEKKHYRRIVKEKEDRFLRDNALRRIPKEERLKIDEINYNLYKKSKAKLKLIEALLSKGRQ